MGSGLLDGGGRVSIDVGWSDAFASKPAPTLDVCLVSWAPSFSGFFRVGVRGRVGRSVLRFLPLMFCR
ncbi:hypothetical protein EAH78_16535 [Pseudomonas arsenicoxydans]|uniref:Uncharacterized protein n=1 Tax=Pseudomonas arsenicoxydans TaxID=702115 RepID=A0A502HSD3_9PSED|nr:hypothetical protein EAH78_16535 [Pseudomonas arsenicoxydans]